MHLTIVIGESLLEHPQPKIRYAMFNGRKEKLFHLPILSSNPQTLKKIGTLKIITVFLQASIIKNYTKLFIVGCAVPFSQYSRSVLDLFYSRDHLSR